MLHIDCINREIIDLTNSLLAAKRENACRVRDLDNLRQQRDKMGEQVARMQEQLAHEKALHAGTQAVLSGVSYDKEALRKEVTELRETKETLQRRVLEAEGLAVLNQRNAESATFDKENLRKEARFDKRVIETLSNGNAELHNERKKLLNEMAKLKEQVATAADLERNPCVGFYWQMRRSLENLLGWDCSVRPGESYEAILAEVKDRLEERKKMALKLDAVRKALS